MIDTMSIRYRSEHKIHRIDIVSIYFRLTISHNTKNFGIFFLLQVNSAAVRQIKPTARPVFSQDGGSKCAEGSVAAIKGTAIAV